MTALNPVQTVGDQIAEVVRLHNSGNKESYERRRPGNVRDGWHSGRTIS